MISGGSGLPYFQCQSNYMILLVNVDENVVVHFVSSNVIYLLLVCVLCCFISDMTDFFIDSMSEYYVNWFLPNKELMFAFYAYSDFLDIFSRTF